MPDLAPVPRDALDPRLAAHLDPGETVLWQGHPRPNTFYSPVDALLPLALVAVGVMIFVGALDGVVFMPEGLFATERLVPSLALIAAGGFAFFVTRARRGRNWVYAITDRRLLSVRDTTLIRSVKPGEIRYFRTRGNIVYWRSNSPKTRSRSRTRESRYPGFHGLDDAEGMKATLERWQEGFSQRAAEAAARFVEAPEAGDGGLPEGVRRLRHPATGLTLDVPADWKTTVRHDVDGPLKIFGITILPRVIRPGEDRDYAEGVDWNRLEVRGAPDAGLTLMILDRPVNRTLDEVLNDPWARRFNLETLKSPPDLEIGGLRGFSVVRKMPAGSNLVSFGTVEAPVATRQAWLGRGDWHVEIVGMARLDQPDVQRAVDAVIESLRIA